VARNRQRAKQRQAERRARRLAEQGRPDDSGTPAAGGRQRAAEPELADPTVVEPSPAVDPELATGAPPQDEGRSDAVIEDEPVLADEDEQLTDAEVEDAELEAEQIRAIEDAELGEAGDGDGAGAYAPTGRRGDVAVAHKDRPRFIQFLIAVWAELQRVQWPDRQALVTLTGVVLGFVLIAGGYLGLLDAIFSRIVEAIL
jgi:preprotein translocase subunit SecE